MNIFVTVGTTSFNSLIKSIDNLAINHPELKFIFQIADGEYKPSNGKYFMYIENIYHYYNSSDLIISHAGAGSIYSLLEINKKTIIVPNTERLDNHQLDIAHFIAENNYALVSWELKDIESNIEKSKTFNYQVFNKVPFFNTMISQI